jgi:hypothetical protein
VRKCHYEPKTTILKKSKIFALDCLMATKYPDPLPVRRGAEVNFNPPEAVPDGKPRKGKVVDYVDVDPVEDPEWGWYYYVSELIEWSGGGKSVRLAYYYAPHGSNRWLWGGQYSIEDEPLVIKALIDRTLAKSNWFNP